MWLKQHVRNYLIICQKSLSIICENVFGDIITVNVRKVKLELTTYFNLSK